MITWADISYFVKQGYLPQLQTDYITQWEAQGAKISDILDTFLSWSQSAGVTFDESRLPDELVPARISEGDYGPKIQVPDGYNQDMWKTWVAPWLQWVPPLAQNLSVPTYIDPGRDLVAPSVVTPYVAPQEPVSIAVAPAPAPVAPVTILSPEPDEPVQEEEKMPSLEYANSSTVQFRTQDGRTVDDTAPPTTVVVSGTNPDGTPQFSFLGDIVKGIGGAIKGGLTGLATGGITGAVTGAIGGALGTGGSKGADTVSIVSDPMIGSPGLVPVSSQNFGLPNYNQPGNQSVFSGQNLNQALELLAGGLGGVPGVLAQGALNLLPGSSPSSSVVSQLPANQPVAMQPLQKQINKAPQGYVLVTREWSPGQSSTIAVQEWYARKMGWYKTPAKPPISVSQWNAVKKASSAKRKIETVYKKAEALTSSKPTRRRR